MVVVQNSHNHLEASLLLNGQDLLNTAVSDLITASHQLLVSLTEDDVKLHMRGSANTIYDKHQLATRLGLQLLAQ